MDMNAFANAMMMKRRAAQERKQGIVGGLTALGTGLIEGQDRLAQKREKDAKEEKGKQAVLAALTSAGFSPEEAGGLVQAGPRAAMDALQDRRRREFEESQQTKQRTRGMEQSRAIFSALGVDGPPELDDPGVASNVGGALAKQKSVGEQGTQMSSLLRPNAAKTEQMPLLNPLGMPHLPSTIPTPIPELPATPRQVAMRGGAMKGVNPDVMKAAMGVAQDAYPKPTAPREFAPRGIDPRSPEGIEAARQIAEAEAAAKANFAPPPAPPDPIKAERARLALEREKLELENLRAGPRGMDPSVRARIQELQAQRRDLDPIVHKEQFDKLSLEIGQLLGTSQPSPAPTQGGGGMSWDEYQQGVK